ncbi:hypothetical protein WJX81_006745 [Elliptochloris bilobata]|uniref:Uncharacterized protein n=1 Tax=Elliptochloris bilobata TaxID=381761 RepID=A0AAW1RQA5_9CHLO
MCCFALVRILLRYVPAPSYSIKARQDVEFRWQTPMRHSHSRVSKLMGQSARDRAEGMVGMQMQVDSNLFQDHVAEVWSSSPLTSSSCFATSLLVAGAVLEALRTMRVALALEVLASFVAAPRCSALVFECLPLNPREPSMLEAIETAYFKRWIESFELEGSEQASPGGRRPAAPQPKAITHLYRLAAMDALEGFTTALLCKAKERDWWRQDAR